MATICGGRRLTEDGRQRLTEGGDYRVIEGYVPCLPFDFGAGSGGSAAGRGGYERPWTVIERPREYAEPVSRETEGERVSLPEPSPGEDEAEFMRRAREDLARQLALLGAIDQLEALFARLMLQERMIWMRRQEEEALLAVLMVATA